MDFDVQCLCHLGQPTDGRIAFQAENAEHLPTANSRLVSKNAHRNTAPLGEVADVVREEFRNAALRHEIGRYRSVLPRLCRIGHSVILRPSFGIKPGRACGYRSGMPRRGISRMNAKLIYRRTTGGDLTAFGLCAAACLACSSPGGDGADSGLMTASSASTMTSATLTGEGDETGGTDEGCTPGHEGCECVDGDLCLGGLECAGGVCQPVSDDATGGEETGCEPGALGCDCIQGPVVAYCDEPFVCDIPNWVCIKEPTSGDPCQSNDECPETDICFPDVCTPIDALYFRMEVAYFNPPSCADGVGSKELYFDYHHGGIWEFSSPNDGCPASWPGTPFTYDSLKTFRIAFWEDDAFDDDFEISTCWQDGNAECDVIPDSVIRAGGFDGIIGGDYEFAMWIDPCANLDACP